MKAKKYYFRNIILLFCVFPWIIFWMKIHEKIGSKCVFFRHVSKIHQKSIKSAPGRLQEAPKTPPGRPKTDFGSVLGAQLGAMLATFSTQDGPGSPRTPPKGVLGNVLARLGGVLGPLGGQEPARDPTRLILEASWVRLGLTFVRFLGDF